jgi:hypothetical protein
MIKELLTSVLLRFCDDIPINHIPAAGNNMVVKINEVVLQLLMLSCINKLCCEVIESEKC